MAQQTQSTATASVAPTDRPADDVEIFSAPGVGAIFQWWAESKVRWAEQNRLKPAPDYKRGS